MNLVLALVIGALMGWASFGLLRVNVRQGLGASVLVGLVGGGIGMQVTSMVSSAPQADGQLNLYWLVIAAASASLSLLIGNTIANRRDT